VFVCVNAIGKEKRCKENHTCDYIRPAPAAMERFIENLTYDPKIPIYKNLQHLLAERKTQLKNETSILFFMNGDSGLGSQLTQFEHNAYYLYTYFNPRLYCYPYFYKNNDFFKYHDDRYGAKNTFFMYFRATRLPPVDAKLDKIYFLENRYYGYFPFFVYKTPPVSLEHNAVMLRHFYNTFNLRIGENVFQYISKIRENEAKPLVGLHVRSAFQKKHHSDRYLSVPIRQRLENLKRHLDEVYGGAAATATAPDPAKKCPYVLFLATDTNLYIQWCREIFGEDVVQYIENIDRIDTEEDSVPNLKNSGFKLGADILYDCLALSLCDCAFVSNSNIPFIINMLNLDLPMFEY
jgi:hypothetical protein